MRPPNKSRLELFPVPVDEEDAPPNKSIEEGGLVAEGGGVGGAGRLDEVVVGFDPPNAVEKSANPPPPLFPVPALAVVVLVIMLVALLFETLVFPNADSKSPKAPLGLLLAFIVSLPRGLKSSSSSTMSS